MKSSIIRIPTVICSPGCEGDAAVTSWLLFWNKRLIAKYSFWIWALLTLLYLAPEVLSGGPYNHAADWWSLGITLLSLVTGKVTTRRPELYQVVTWFYVGHWSLCICLFFFSFQFLQSWTTTPCWTRSEIFLMTCPGPSALLSPSCSLRSFNVFTFHGM